MDHPNKKNKKDKKYPRVPIKTYKWEDIRRARKKGGYPWTHLYKQPLREKTDPEVFTMEVLRKSKSASVLGKSEGVTISEITGKPTKDFGKYLESLEKIEDLETLQIITEPDDHSIKNNTGSIAIEECEMSDSGSHKPENVALESADSSDNISQYLDKEERSPHKFQLSENLQIPAKENKTEEESKRKRKFSADSSYSRLSLPKLAMINKLKDTKNRIKVPKLTFPTSKMKKPVSKKLKNSPTENKKENKKTSTQQKNSKPVYIHIPLKPPPGQTDEFSYLEFEEKSDKKTQETKKFGSFRGVVKNIKQLQKTKLAEEQEKSNLIPPAIVENTESSYSENISIGNEKINEQKKESDIFDKKIYMSEETNTQNETTAKEDIDKPKQLDVKILHEDQNITPESLPEGLKSKDEYTKQVYDKNTDEEIDTHLEEANDEKDANDIFDKLFEARTSSYTETNADIHKAKQTRSKSAEPERKRKLSLESSYSRKSLSKLGILKKLKETSDKIKNSLSRSNLKKQSKLEETYIKDEIKTPTKKKLKPVKPVEPVYIRIPLKLPEGQTDEFSYLEFEDKKPSQNKESKETSPESPVQRDGVQFIILTAPSDEEILDYHSSDVPETPSSDNKLFFCNKIEELKELAKDVVDEISSPLQTKLDTVTEETNSDKVRNEETDSKTETEDVNQIKLLIDNSHIVEEKMMVDEEDGLNESVTKQEIVANSTLEKIENETIDQPVESKIKSNLKDENSPVIKKKVSFKRRSKIPKDGIYEDIQIPKLADESKKISETKTSVLTNQSMSVDEERTYLDEKIIKTTSLEEDYNKWSKIR